MSEAPHITDAMIVGGGLNGMTLSLALASVGLRVTLIDRQAQNPGSGAFDGRSYAMAQGSKRMLDALGLWSALDTTSQPILRIVASDGRAGEGPQPLFLSFDAGALEEGPMGYMVEDRHLRPMLLAAVAAEARITHVEGEVAGQSVTEAQAEVILDSGEVLRGRLLIGADGAESKVALRAGIKSMGWGYGQSALVTAVSHALPHNGVAHQFFMPEGPLAILPLPDNRASIVWTEATDRAADLQALSNADYLTVLRPRFGDFLGDVRLTGTRYTYPLALSLASAFTAPRLALVGDAAHRVHPIAGQGLNQGLRDIAALAEVLSDARKRGEDIASGPVLDRYARWRRFDATTLAMATDGFNRLFSNDSAVLRSVRGLGMGILNALPGANRAAMREAAGLTGDLPKLMQGRRI